MIAPAKKERSPKTILLTGVVLALLLIAGAAWLFLGVFQGNYLANVKKESAAHISEISGQITGYIEDEVDSGWVTVSTVSQVLDAKSWSDDAQLLGYLSTLADLWEVDDIRLYTKGGVCIDKNGQFTSVDSAAKTVAKLQNSSRLFLISESRIEYVLAVDSPMQLAGDRVVAVSVIKDLEPLLDTLHISTFDNTAHLYLTQENGTKISKLNNVGSSDVFNVIEQYSTGTCQFFNPAVQSYQQAIACPDNVVFLYHNGDTREYVALTQVDVQDGFWNLLYTVPEDAVNLSTNSFSRMLVTGSIVIILLLLCMATAIFVILYRNSKAKYGADILARDRMLDLLSKNTSLAISLVSKRQEKPLYVTPNAEELLFAHAFELIPNAAALQFKAVPGVSGELDTLNAQLRQWDCQKILVSEYLPIKKTDATRFYTFTFYPISDSEDEVMIILQDVTATRQREEALKNAMNTADSANRAKTKFLSSMSHDIRTPMNAIVNMTRFALELPDNSPEMNEYLSTIENSSTHLLALINDLLDVSRIETGKFTLTKEPFSMHACIENVGSIIRPLSDRKKQTFTVDTTGIKAEKIIGDQLKLSQILINLLNNAVKFTPQGGTVSLTVRECNSLRKGSVSYTFAVADNGAGIARGDLEKIFLPFERLDSTSVRNVEGSGLGLAICKSYAELMGGAIGVQSEPGKGSVFTLELYFELESSEAQGAPQESRQAALTAQYDFTGKRALLAEDHDVNRRIAVKLLERMGFAVDCAVNGEEAVQKFVQSANGYYDLIYLDIQMPVMNGHDAARRIRACDHPPGRHDGEHLCRRRGKVPQGRHERAYRKAHCAPAACRSNRTGIKHKRRPIK